MRVAAGTPGAIGFTIEVDPVFSDLAPRFLTGCREDSRKIHLALVTRDFETIEQLGQRMHGSGGGLGFDFDFVSEITGEIQQFARRKDEASVRTAIQTLDHFLDHVDIVTR